MRKRNVIVSIAAAAVVAVAAAGGALWYVRRAAGPQEATLGQHTTNGTMVFTDNTPAADPRLTGFWRCEGQPEWYKVYYDDYDSDGFFWGKEWNEAEDVHEEDLKYHGNGWFRWRIAKKELEEIHCQDELDVPIRKVWAVRFRHDSVMQQTDKYFSANSSVFKRVRR